jgi:polyphosphate kinase 2 (PPK2 family)
MKKVKSLSKVLSKKQKPSNKKNLDERIEILQKRILCIQQGIWHTKSRVILVFEGFDASGKGGTIRKITEKVDPRGVHVHPIGAPEDDDQAKHYLFRFWQKLPRPGTLAIFDRSWYGRLLVEKVEKLTPENRIRHAPDEINQFEHLLAVDGVIILKFFLAVSKDEQLRRYQDRLRDPSKRWKITKDDIRARKKWRSYVHAVDEIFKKTDRPEAPWFLIPSDQKDQAHVQVLEILCDQLAMFERWMNSEKSKWLHQDMKKQLKLLEKEI